MEDTPVPNNQQGDGPNFYQFILILFLNLKAHFLLKIPVNHILSGTPKKRNHFHPDSSESFSGNF